MAVLSIPSVRNYRFSALHIGLQFFLHTCVNRQRLVGKQQAGLAFIGPLPHIFRPTVFAAFDIFAVTERCLIKGSLVIAHGMGRAEKMPSRFNLARGITRKRFRAAIEPCTQFLIAAQTVHIHHQLFKSSAEPTFHPTGCKKNKIGAGQHSGMHGNGTLISRLCDFDFACGQRFTTAQRQSRSPRHLTNDIVRQDRFWHAKGWRA